MADNFIIPQGLGAVPDKPDERDFRFYDVMGAEWPDWDTGYEIEAPLKVENQNGSLSCVGQVFSKYAEVLDWYEDESETDLSAKDIYSPIRLPNGGAYLRDAANWTVDNGICEERLSPSYDNGNPPTDDFFKNYARTQEIIDNAKVYASKEYRSVYPDIDEFALAIKRGHGMAFAILGCNGEWSTAYPTSNLKGTVWGHALYATGFKKINGKKYIHFLNSWGKGWGEQGYGWLSEDYFKEHPLYGIPVYSGWTLIDKPNIMTNVKIIKDADSPAVGFWLPQTSAEALKSNCETFGLTCPTKEDGSVDWEKVPLDGILSLTK